MIEGNPYDAATDGPGSSPWMTQNSIDGRGHAWLATCDARIPPMITAFGRYLERYGWIDAKTVATVGKDWRDPCSGPGGQISWYWSSAHVDRAKLIAIENSDGRSEERRLGEGCVSTCRTRWLPYHLKKKQNTY